MRVRLYYMYDVVLKLFARECLIGGLSAGVVVSPLRGVSGGLTKLFEGVSNTTTLFDDKFVPSRVRPFPRAFYGSGRVLRPYSLEDSVIVASLRQIRAGRVRFVLVYVVYRFEFRRVPTFWTYGPLCCACAQRPGLPRQSFSRSQRSQKT